MLKNTLGDKIFDVINIIAMAVITFLMIYPFWYVFIISLNDNTVQSWVSVYLWPKQVTTMSYKIILSTSLFLNGYKITIIRTVLGTFLSVILSGMAAYVLSRKELIGRNAMLTLLLITLYFGGGLIPTYLLLYNLGMINTFSILVIPALMNSWNIILMKTFFSQLPNEIMESAKIDGANDLHIFFSFVLPISKPIIAAITLFTAVGLWNDWFAGEMFISDQNLLPIQTVLRRVIYQMKAAELMQKMGNIAGSTQTGSNLESVKMASIMVTVLPIVFVYPFLQKYFVKGIMIGSLKG